jgi:hypothetical protein
MNERIQELSDIAYKNHLARNPNSSFGRRSDYDREFAELIVRECAELADDGYGSTNFGNGICGAQVLKHFGVEE